MTAVDSEDAREKADFLAPVGQRAEWPTIRPDRLPYNKHFPKYGGSSYKRLDHSLDITAPVAQWIERLFPKRKAVGSTPTWRVYCFYITIFLNPDSVLFADFVAYKTSKGR